MKGCLKTILMGIGLLTVLGVVMVLVITAMPTSSSNTIRQRPTASAAATRVCATEAGYEDLMRNADLLEGCSVNFVGKVVQVGDDWTGGWVRVIIDGSNDFSTDAVYVQYDHHHRILENDRVRVIGYADGRIDYKTVLGAATSAPRIEGESVYVIE